MAAISGVTRSFTKAVITAANAIPITTPTARSTTLPRSRNVLKPRISVLSLRHRQHDFSELIGGVEPPQSRLYLRQRIDAIDHRLDSFIDGVEHRLELVGVAHGGAEQVQLTPEQPRHGDLGLGAGGRAAQHDQAAGND